MSTDEDGPALEAKEGPGEASRPLSSSSSTSERRASTPGTPGKKKRRRRKSSAASTAKRWKLEDVFLRVVPVDKTPRDDWKNRLSPRSHQVLQDLGVDPDVLQVREREHFLIEEEPDSEVSDVETEQSDPEEEEEKEQTDKADDTGKQEVQGAKEGEAKEEEAKEEEGDGEGALVKDKTQGEESGDEDEDDAKTESDESEPEPEFREGETAEEMAARLERKREARQEERRKREEARQRKNERERQRKIRKAEARDRRGMKAEDSLQRRLKRAAENARRRQATRIAHESYVQRRHDLMQLCRTERRRRIDEKLDAIVAQREKERREKDAAAAEEEKGEGDEDGSVEGYETDDSEEPIQIMLSLHDVVNTVRDVAEEEARAKWRRDDKAWRLQDAKEQEEREEYVNRYGWDDELIRKDEEAKKVRDQKKKDRKLYNKVFVLSPRSRRACEAVQVDFNDLKVRTLASFAGPDVDEQTQRERHEQYVRRRHEMGHMVRMERRRIILEEQAVVLDRGEGGDEEEQDAEAEAAAGLAAARLGYGGRHGLAVQEEEGEEEQLDPEQLAALEAQREREKKVNPLTGDTLRERTEHRQSRLDAFWAFVEFVEWPSRWNRTLESTEAHIRTKYSDEEVKEFAVYMDRYALVLQDQIERHEEHFKNVNGGVIDDRIRWDLPYEVISRGRATYEAVCKAEDGLANFLAAEKVHECFVYTLHPFLHPQEFPGPQLADPRGPPPTKEGRHPDYVVKWRHFTDDDIYHYVKKRRGQESLIDPPAMRALDQQAPPLAT